MHSSCRESTHECILQGAGTYQAQSTHVDDSGKTCFCPDSFNLTSCKAFEGNFAAAPSVTSTLKSVEEEDSAVTGHNEALKEGSRRQSVPQQPEEEPITDGGVTEFPVSPAKNTAAAETASVSAKTVPATAASPEKAAEVVPAPDADDDEELPESKATEEELAELQKNALAYSTIPNRKESVVDISTPVPYTDFNFVKMVSLGNEIDGDTQDDDKFASELDLQYVRALQDTLEDTIEDLGGVGSKQIDGTFPYITFHLIIMQRSTRALPLQVVRILQLTAETLPTRRRIATPT